VPQEAPRGNETILLVEDDPTLRQATLRTLRQQGYQVIATASGPEALRQWEEHQGRIDLMITDLLMPESMNGLALAEQLRRENNSLKVILCSGYRTQVPQPGALAQSGIGWLPKPYDPKTLATTVRACLDQA
jgi:two-component system cell cycle sensor histidine kinase/response regulator CckA